MSDLRIQIVIYRPDIPSLRRAVESVALSAARAMERRLLESAEVRVGDSSPSAALEDGAAIDIASAAAEHGVALEYTYFGANLGSAGGSNRLAEGFGGRYILILNPDTYSSPDLVSRMVERLREGFDAVDARQIPLEHPKEYDAVSGQTSWLSGACLMVKREAFEGISGFDDDHFFLHCDDVDFSWRLRLNGGRIATAPAAVVFHDKRLDAEGQHRPPDVERYHGVLGRLLLAHRFGREDIISSTRAWVRKNGAPSQLSALEEFARREAERQLPQQAQDADSVATFVGANYAPHRF